MVWEWSDNCKSTILYYIYYIDIYFHAGFFLFILSLVATSRKGVDPASSESSSKPSMIDSRQVPFLSCNLIFFRLKPGLKRASIPSKPKITLVRNQIDCHLVIVRHNMNQRSIMLLGHLMVVCLLLRATTRNLNFMIWKARTNLIYLVACQVSCMLSSMQVMNTFLEQAMTILSVFGVLKQVVPRFFLWRFYCLIIFCSIRWRVISVTYTAQRLRRILAKSYLVVMIAPSKCGTFIVVLVSFWLFA